MASLDTSRLVRMCVFLCPLRWSYAMNYAHVSTELDQRWARGDADSDPLLSLSLSRCVRVTHTPSTALRYHNGIIMKPPPALVGLEEALASAVTWHQNDRILLSPPHPPFSRRRSRVTSLSTRMDGSYWPTSTLARIRSGRAPPFRAWAP